MDNNRLLRKFASPANTLDAIAGTAQVTYLNAALDLLIVALFGWLLLELANWVGGWLYDRATERERKANVDRLIAKWADEDRDFARMQKRIRGEE
jgi:NhaP-type Na+/H+ or K+/H+ antiporter